MVKNVQSIKAKRLSANSCKLILRNVVLPTCEFILPLVLNAQTRSLGLHSIHYSKTELSYVNNSLTSRNLTKVIKNILCLTLNLSEIEVQSNILNNILADISLSFIESVSCRTAITPQQLVVALSKRRQLNL